MINSADNAAKSTQRLTILAIDDEVINLSLLQVFFAERDEQLLLCSNGQHAIELLQDNSQHVDIVFLDLMMPDIDGFTVLNTIRQLPTRKRLPVIIQSGKADHASIERAMSAGADSYLMKPFSLDELPALFQQCIANKNQNPH